MKEKTYKLGNSTLTLRFGDITQTESQVIVSSDDYYLSMGGGVSGAILRAGGNEIALDAAKKVPAEIGEVVITTAGHLKSQFVFHAITIGKSKEAKDSKSVIESITVKCMELLSTLNLTSISFPALGAGVAGFSYEDVAVEMSKVISEYLLKTDKSLEVIIYLFDRYGRMQPIDYVGFFEAFATKASQFAAIHSLEPKLESATEILSIDPNDTEREIRSKRLHELRKLLGKLEEQRIRLEQKLIDLLESNDDEGYKKVKALLKENEELRLARLKELRDLAIDSDRPARKAETPIVF